MANWRDRLKPARWRGVAFHVDAVDLEAGRRVVLHEYPLRDLPSSQDLGRAQRKISVTAYLLGGDYLDRRDRLLEALEQPGPGTLELPSWPAQQMVLAGAGKIAESKSEGGICRISLNFAEAGEAVHPLPVGQGPDAAAERTVAARSAARDRFARNWRTASPGSRWLSSAIGDALSREWLGLLRGMSAIASDLGLSDSLGGRLLGEALTLGQTLERNGRSIPTRALGIVAALVDPVVGSSAADALFVALDALSAAAKWSDAPWIGTSWPRGATQPGWSSIYPETDDRRVLRCNRAALAGLVSHAVFIERCRHLCAYRPTSSRDAAERRFRLMADFDDLAGRIGAADDASSNLVGALTDAALGAASALNLAAQSADLVLLRLASPASALVLAYDRYEDERRAPEIVARNAIVHPLALPVDRDLEILAR